MAKLTDAQLATLVRGSQRPDGLISPAAGTKPHTAQAMAYKLLDAALVERVAAAFDEPNYGQMQDGEFQGFRLTAEGFDAVGVSAEERPAYCAPVVEGLGVFGDAGEEGATLDARESAALKADYDAANASELPAAKPTLGVAADAVLAAWGLVLGGTVAGVTSSVVTHMAPSIEKLTAARAPKAAKVAREPRAVGELAPVREGSKMATVLALVSRPQGCTIADVCAATTWTPTSARGFLSTLHVKRGMPVTSAKGADGVRVYSLAAEGVAGEEAHAAA